MPKISSLNNYDGTPLDGDEKLVIVETEESETEGITVDQLFTNAPTAGTAVKRALPEPWEPEDFLRNESDVAPTVDQVLTHYPWESIAGINKIPRFLLDFTRIEKIPNTLQRNHVRSSVATRWDSSGDLVEDSSGTLRLQRDPKTQEVLGLLYEPKRTQLLGSPQDITSADWDEQQVSTSSNVGGEKSQNYDQLQEDSNSGFHRIDDKYGRQTEEDPIAGSLIAKANGRNWVALESLIRDDDNSDVDFPRAFFDLQNGATGSATNTTNCIVLDHSIQELGNGWYRCNFAIKPDALWAGVRLYIELSDGDGSLSYTGDGSSGIYIMHTQAEVSREVTSPILTGGAVREADTVDYRFDFPDITTGVAYSIEQQFGDNLSISSPGPKFGTTSSSDKRHGVLMYDAGLNTTQSDGWFTVTRNSDEDSTGGRTLSPENETIDRFEVVEVDDATFIVRQIAIWTQQLTSTQKSDLKSNYLTSP